MKSSLSRFLKKCHSEPSIKRELKLGLLGKVSASTAKVQLQVRKQRLSDLTHIVGTVLFLLFIIRYIN